jgi:hypothetical protein
MLTIADNLGAVSAGATSVIGVSVFSLGQIPTPDGTPTWLVAVLISVGPALAWFLTRVLSASAAYYSAVKTTSLRRISEHRSIAVVDRGPDSITYLIRLEDIADRAEAKEAALRALTVPNSKTGT